MDRDGSAATGDDASSGGSVPRRQPRRGCGARREITASSNAVPLFPPDNRHITAVEAGAADARSPAARFQLDGTRELPRQRVETPALPGRFPRHLHDREPGPGRFRGRRPLTWTWGRSSGGPSLVRPWPAGSAGPSTCRLQRREGHPQRWTKALPRFQSSSPEHRFARRDCTAHSIKHGRLFLFPCSLYVQTT